MTEQLEDDFWAQERARDAAERGRQAYPSACGTCRAAVEAGGQVEHDGCAQRATLLPAPDAPGYELITGLSEEELAQLPARFHTPVFLDTATPQSWVCAVCWGEGWVTGWPCKTAQKHGAQVFTPEHQAETAAKRQTARIAELEKQLAEYEPMNPQQCPKGLHADWLVDSEHAHACPWCRIAELEEQRERRRVRLVAAEADLLEMRGLLSPNGHPRRIPDEVEIHERVAPAVEWLLNRVAELEAGLKRYVGHLEVREAASNVRPEGNRACGGSDA